MRYILIQSFATGKNYLFREDIRPLREAPENGNSFLFPFQSDAVYSDSKFCAQENYLLREDIRALREAPENVVFEENGNFISLSFPKRCGIF
ncbi:MAG: hypothetical protein V4594_02540 [Bacteroidota bacterium]